MTTSFSTAHAATSAKVASREDDQSSDGVAIKRRYHDGDQTPFFYFH